jgi:hypothetical protein
MELFTQIWQAVLAFIAVVFGFFIPGGITLPF